MRLMTGRTVRLGHVGRVRRMTGNTFRNSAVASGVAEVTGEGRVLARAGHHLLVGTGMTGDTNLLVFSGQGDIQRLVRIVATEAVLNLVMGAA